MTACQTLAQSLSATPLATSYPTTPFSLPLPYHYEVTDLSSYTLYLFPLVQAADEAVNGAADIVRNGSRQQIAGTVAVAALIGWVLGRQL